MGAAWALFGNPALRLIDSERAHSLSMQALKSIGESNIGQSVLNSLYKEPIYLLIVNLVRTKY